MKPSDFVKAAVYSGKKFTVQGSGAGRRKEGHAKPPVGVLAKSAHAAGHVCASRDLVSGSLVCPHYLQLCCPSPHPTHHPRSSPPSQPLLPHTPARPISPPPPQQMLRDSTRESDSPITQSHRRLAALCADVGLDPI